jgi:hypothetical protein
MYEDQFRYPFLKTSLFRIQLQLLKAMNGFLKTLNCGAFIFKISISVRNFGKRSCQINDLYPTVPRIRYDSKTYRTNYLC